jgi:hypothetical protein
MRLSSLTNTRSKAAAVVAVVLACAAIAAWFGVTDRGDSSGPRYILWKYGMLPFDPTVTYPAMVGDRQRDSLVVGLTVPELKHRFGNLRTRVESTTDYHYSDNFLLDQEILRLGDS